MTAPLTDLRKIVVPEDEEFEEPTPVTEQMSFSINRRVQHIKNAKYLENQREIAMRRLAERQSAFQRKIQYETAMIRKAIAVSRAGKVTLTK